MDASNKNWSSLAMTMSSARSTTAWLARRWRRRIEHGLKLTCGRRARARDFVPRKLNARSKPAPKRQQPVAGPSAPAPKDIVKTTSLADTDYVAIVTLALSDYALLYDPELRYKIDQSEEHFVPLLDLLRKHNLPEAPVAKSLRSHATDMIDVRMVLAAPSYDSRNTKDVGMFQVRRKSPPTTAYTHHDWKQRTIYVENCPVQYSSLHGIFTLVQALLTDSCDPHPTSDRIQGIAFLPHHLDKPGDPPKCKNFALVTLLHLEDAERLLRDWPWDQSSSAGESSTRYAAEATKFGFRTLSKARWDELKDEYLAHRSRLVEEMVARQVNEPVARPSVKRARSRSKSVEKEYPNGLSPMSAFPPNCLAYIKNVHVGTNKTTLKTLLSQAFLGDTGGIDYVDFNKGMDTCHIRLASPDYTQKLAAYFSERELCQKNGLDGKGEVGGKPCIVVEVVRGRQEELYWEKVPLKIRREAVDKALGSCGGNRENSKRKRK